MEYTKDMILGVRYGEIRRTIKNKKEKKKKDKQIMGRNTKAQGTNSYNNFYASIY